jgi:hypothetical protein
MIWPPAADLSLVADIAAISVLLFAAIPHPAIGSTRGRLPAA